MGSNLVAIDLLVPFLAMNSGVPTKWRRVGSRALGGGVTAGTRRTEFDLVPGHEPSRATTYRKLFFLLLEERRGNGIIF